MNKTNFFKFENKEDDFPFYNDDKTAFTPIQSLFLVIASIGSVILFIFLGATRLNFLTPFINIIVPLGSLMIVVKSNWIKLFRKVHFKDVILVILVLITNLIVTFLVGFLTVKFASADVNPAVHIIQGNSPINNLKFFLMMIPMLFGEELITIIPFLVILQFAKRNLNTSRKTAIIIAWIVSALIFGAMHLPTYNWNIIQAVLSIGIARLILTFPYIKTKNILISLFVHILNDWILFLPFLLMSFR